VDDASTTGLDVEDTTDTGGATADAVEDATTTGEETTDTGGARDDAGGTTGDDVDTTGTDDTGEPFDCEVDGAVGCPCDVSADCDSKVCLIEDGVCSDSCSGADDCPDGMDCLPSGSDGSSVPVSICAPEGGKLCQPCTKDADCAAAGEDAGLPSGCVDYQGVGAFCAVNCFETDTCPAGYACEPKTTIDGVQTALCVKVDEPCECTKLSVKLELASACQVTNELGSCGGIRTCGLEGLSDCDAATPAAEVCDSVDNDCNGVTDDGLCDDGIDCTADACIQEPAGCEYTPDNSECDENLDCTTTTCDVDAGGCKTVTNEAACEDDNECTKTTCDPDVGCQTALLEQACNDGSKCTLNDECVAGKCTGDAPDCDDGVPCTADSCDPASGCTNVPTAGPCDDSDKCTLTDTCVDGDCVGTPDLCDDGKPCTYDTCDSLTGCSSIPLGDGTFCDDGDKCTSDDSCLAGACSGSVAVCIEESINISAFQSFVQGTHAIPGGTNQYPNGGPAVAALGGGRYVTHWAGASGKFARISDRHGSREDEEFAVGGKTGEFNTGVASLDDRMLFISWDTPPTCGPGNCDISNLSPKLRVQEYDETGALTGSATMSSFTGGSGGGGIDVQAFHAVPMVVTGGDWLVMYSYTATWGFVGSFDPADDLVYWRRYGKGVGNKGSGVLPAMSTTFARFDAKPVAAASADLAIAWVDATTTTVKLGQYLGSNAVTTPVDVANEGSEVTSVAVGPGAGGGSGAVVLWTVDSSVRGRMYDGELNPTTSAFDVSPAGAAGDQRLGGVGIFSDGGFVAVYDDELGDSDAFAVKAQRFTKFGGPTGVPIDINGYEEGDQIRPSVAVLPDDEWVVVFASGDEVFTRRFAKDGSAASGRLERRANATVDGGQSAPVGAFVDGGALVAFGTPIGDAGSEEIRAQRVTGTGQPIGPELLVNEVTNGTQSDAAVAAGAGRFVVAWETEDTDGRGIGFRVFGADGEAQTKELGGNAVTGGSQKHPAASVGPDGVITLLWDGPSTSPDVSMRRFSATGEPLSADIVVNAATGGPQEHPAVASLGLTGLLVAWQSSPSGHADIVIGRTTASAASGEQAVLNTTNSGEQTRPSVAASAAGDQGMACWESDGQAGPGLTVVCRAITIEAAALGVGLEFTPHVVQSGDQRNPAVAAVATGFVIAWETPNVDGDSTAVQYQLRGADGDVLSPRVLANRGRPGAQGAPFVAPDGPDSFMVGWQTDPAKNGSLDVLVRVFPVD